MHYSDPDNDSSVTATLTIDGVEYDIDGVYIPGDPGQLYGLPENCYPPGDPEIEVLSITLNGEPVPPALAGMLDDDARDAIEQAYWSR